MIRKRITTMILLTLLTMLPVISVVMMYHITLCDTMSKMDSKAFGDSCVLYKVSDNATKKEVGKKLEAISDRVSLYTEQKVGKYTVEAIYFNQYYINFPMKSGRFFRKSDLAVGNQVAVIGKNLEKNTYCKNGDTYILLEGKEYEILGVIGYEEETMIDNYIYISLLTADDVVHSSLYTLDIWGETSNASEEFFELLQKGGIKAEELSGMKSYGMAVFPKIMYGRWFFCIFLCDLLCIAVVSVQWIKLQKQEIGVRRLVGASIVDIVSRMTGKYLLYVGISMAISISFCMIEFSGYFRSLMVGYAITLPIVFVLLIVNVISTARTPLEEAIRS